LYAQEKMRTDPCDARSSWAKEKRREQCAYCGRGGMAHHFHPVPKESCEVAGGIHKSSQEEEGGGKKMVSLHHIEKKGQKGSLCRANAEHERGQCPSGPQRSRKKGRKPAPMEEKKRIEDDIRRSLRRLIKNRTRRLFIYWGKGGLELSLYLKSTERKIDKKQHEGRNMREIRMSRRGKVKVRATQD